MDLEHAKAITSGGWDHPDNWLFANRQLNQARGNTPLLEYLRSRVKNSVEAKNYYGSDQQDQRYRQNNQQYMEQAYEKYPELRGQLEELGIDPSKIGLTRNTGERHGEGAYHISKMSSEDITEVRTKMDEAGIPKNVTRQLFQYPDPSMGEQEYENLRLTSRHTESQDLRIDEWKKRNKDSFFDAARDKGIDDEIVQDFWDDESERLANRTRYRLEDPDTEKERGYFDLNTLLQPEAEEVDIDNITGDVIAGFEEDEPDIDISNIEDDELDLSGLLGDINSAIVDEPEEPKKSKTFNDIRGDQSQPKKDKPQDDFESGMDKVIDNVDNAMSKEEKKLVDKIEELEDLPENERTKKEINRLKAKLSALRIDN